MLLQLKIKKKLIETKGNISNCLSLFKWTLPNWHSMFFEDIDPYSIPNFHFMLCIFKDIDPILIQNVHFMLSGRYWSHIPDSHECIRRTVRISGPIFSNISPENDFQYSEITNNICGNCWVFFLNYLESFLVSPKLK